MDDIRRRIPFTFNQDDEVGNADQPQILDEQEQEEMIAKLRAQNVATDRKAILVLQVVLAMSSLVHLLTLVTSANILALLPIFAHLNLFLILIHHPHALSFRITFILAFIPLLLAYFHLGGFDSTRELWWLTHLVAPAMVWLSQNVLGGIDKTTEGLETLEGMKYRAMGA